LRRKDGCVMSLLELRNVTKIFSVGGLLRRRHILAVDDISLSIPEDRPVTVALVGESGSGKTTIGRLVLAFLKPTSGKILWQGKDVWKIDGKERQVYRKNAQAVFQDPYESLDPTYTTVDTLMEPIKKFKLAGSRSEAIKIITDTIESLGLRSDTLAMYPHQLSGGQKQRIMLARAVLLKARLIVADEPVSMIDASLRASILGLMREIKENYGVSFLYITHDISTASILADQIVVVYLGSLMEFGGFDDMVTQPMHPYVKLLMDSVPIPDPKRRWKGEVKIKEDEGEILPKDLMKFKSRCKFCQRCGEAKEICHEKPPPSVDVGKDHKVLCWLYA